MNTSGGAIHTNGGSNITIRTSEYVDNEGTLDGGAIYSELSSVFLSYCNFDSNTATSTAADQYFWLFLPGSGASRLAPCLRCGRVPAALGSAGSRIVIFRIARILSRAQIVPHNGDCADHAGSGKTGEASQQPSWLPLTQASAPGCV